MTPITLALLIFSIMLLLMVIRVPIAGAMFLAGTAGFILQTGVAPYLNFLNNLAFARLANYDLSVIPLFILMGHFATQGGISKALFQFAAAVMGRFKGGLAMGAVLACGAFGAICGSSVATAATITGVALPEMKRHGYSGRLATGTLAAGGTLGIQLPPSVVLVIYAILTEQNISKLFAAAVVPGLIALFGYMLAVAIYVRVVPGQAPEVDPNREPLTLGKVIGVLPIITIFSLVFGGIYGGFFTPTEGAAVGAASTLLIAIFKREMTVAKLMDCFLGTAASAAMIFLIFIGAAFFGMRLTRTSLIAALVSYLGLAVVFVSDFSAGGSNVTLGTALVLLTSSVPPYAYSADTPQLKVLLSSFCAPMPKRSRLNMKPRPKQPKPLDIRMGSWLEILNLALNMS